MKQFHPFAQEDDVVLICNLSLNDDELYRKSMKMAESMDTIDHASKELVRLEDELAAKLNQPEGIVNIMAVPMQAAQVKRHYMLLAWLHRHLETAREMCLMTGVETSEADVDHALAGEVEKLLDSTKGFQGIGFSHDRRADARLFVTQLAYMRSGRRIYEVSDGLAQKLRLTEVRGLYGQDFHLPYPAVYISVPRIAELLVPAPKVDQDSPLDGLLVREAKTLEPGLRRLNIFATNLEFPEDLMFEHWVWMEMPIWDDRPLDESLERFLDSAPKDVRPQYRDQWRDVFQWTMNVTLYATQPDLDVETFVPNEEARRLWKKLRTNRNPRQKSKAQKALNQLTYCTVKRLGSKTVVDRTMSVAALRASNEGRALNVRTLVAGHHKMQVHGKGRAERKRVFIEPYWRGPEDAPLSEAHHVLEARGV